MVERVDGSELEVASISVAELRRRLSELVEPGNSQLLAFDADGTLWAGDVGEDVFRHVASANLLKSDAMDALARLAEEYGLEPGKSPLETAQRVFASYTAGHFPEREVCAMMTWCYAGFSRGELAALAREAFGRAGLADRLRRELSPIFEFARAERLRVVVVSASPQGIVEQAAALWGIAPEDVFASRPAYDGDRIATRLAEPVPYAEEKPKALARHASGSQLLAAFGDNVFDMDLLRAARIGVAVHPKLVLRARLPELLNTYLLTDGATA